MKKVGLSLWLLPVMLLHSSCRGYTVHDSRQLTAVIVIGGIILLFLALAACSNMLRDEVSNCEEFDANAEQMQKKQKTRISRKRPFSLTRVQLGLWTVIIGCTYIYLSLYKGDCAEGPVNKTALVLAAIFSVTVAGSAIIDKREIGDNRSRHQNTPSHGFFTDILSDDDGISLHRFQYVVWTIIAVAVYLYKLSGVQTGCRMPELSDTLLALTGISSATYLLLRAGENDPPAADTDTGSDMQSNKNDNTGQASYDQKNTGFYG
ncbi:MAG: hypothetical protein ABW019_18375 [Chitinophagaceae bacterium]